MSNKNKEKEDEAFLKSIVGTLPLNKTNKIQKTIPHNKTILKKEINVNQKVQETNKLTITNNYLANKNQETNLHTNEKNKINKKLKRGKISIDKKIDFHGYSLFEAEEIFSQTIKDCYIKNLRCILFVTGKGILKKNEDTSSEVKLYYGKIRNSFINWTKKEETQKLILSVEQANLEHGADGAFYVYLRKNKF